jgi:hypothetical protein
MTRSNRVATLEEPWRKFQKVGTRGRRGRSSRKTDVNPRHLAQNRGLHIELAAAAQVRTWPTTNAWIVMMRGAAHPGPTGPAAVLPFAARNLSRPGRRHRAFLDPWVLRRVYAGGGASAFPDVPAPVPPRAAGPAVFAATTRPRGSAAAPRPHHPHPAAAAPPWALANDAVAREALKGKRSAGVAGIALINLRAWDCCLLSCGPIAVRTARRFHSSTFAALTAG